MGELRAVEQQLESSFLDAVGRSPEGSADWFTKCTVVQGLRPSWEKGTSEEWFSYQLRDRTLLNPSVVACSRDHCQII